MKLSKAQEDVLVLLCEGDIYFSLIDQSLGLEDGDKNSYIIRKDTFYALLKHKVIEVKRLPSIYMEQYGLSKLGEAYLMQYRKKDIAEFITTTHYGRK